MSYHSLYTVVCRRYKVLPFNMDREEVGHAALTVLDNMCGM